MEIWKDVVGYEGRYEVSNLGRIRTVERRIIKSNGHPHTIPSRIRKTYIINSGYEAVNLKVNRKGHTELVHRLVAMAFCEGYEDGLDTNHKDADRLNNKADNLEWVTRRENILDVIKRGKFNIESAHKVARVKRRKKVAQYSIDGDFIAEYPSLRDAQNSTGTSESQISTVCNGHRKTANGFVWKFVS